MQHFQTQIFQLAFEIAEAQARSERRVDFQRLFGHGLLPRLRKAGNRAHIMQPVGQLDENHPDILGHGEEHPAEILRLFFLFRFEFDLRQLGHAHNERADLFAEHFADIRFGARRILHDVVQKRRGDRAVIESEIEQNIRHRDRVNDIRLARLALLPVVHFLRIGKRPFQYVRLLRREYLPAAGHQIFHTGTAAIYR